MKILHIDSSARSEASVTRNLSAQLVTHLGGDVIRRDLAQGVSFINESWVGATFTPEGDRSAAQNDALAQSDTLVQELMDADALVIGAPVYNFSLPASLKAWIDQIARAGVTFRYTEDGPEGLLSGKRAFIIVGSGGVPVESPVDFLTPYLRHVLGFVGISDVTIIAADKMNAQADAQIKAAMDQISKIAA